MAPRQAPAVVFGVILGTGTGGGVVVRRPRADGLQRRSPASGGTTRCRGRGRRVARARVLLRPAGLHRDVAVGARAGARPPSATGCALTGAAIVEAAGTGRSRRRGTLARYAPPARGLASVINVLDPDVIVLGGGLSRIGSLYEDVPRQWGAWVFSDRVDTRLVPPRFGDASGVRGAAWLWDAGDVGR